MFSAKEYLGMVLGVGLHSCPLEPGATDTLRKPGARVLPKKVREKAEQARAKQAEEEDTARELDRILDRWRAGTNTGLPSDTPILSGLPLRNAKQRLLARQIVASVGAEDAAMVTAREATQAVNVGPPQTLATETQKVTPQNSDKPVALTELATELDYANVLPDALPVLLHLDKLKTAEHKRFDMIPGLIAFARDCLDLKLDDVHRDAALEGEKESPIAVETDQLSAVSPIMLPPVRALPKPLSVDLPLPNGKDEDSSKLEPARSQLAPIDENTVGERPSAESPPAMLRATDDSSSSATSPADAVPSYNTDPSTKLS
jgi:hypothetical protein